MLRGEGGGAWDIVCGDEKGDVFESMVLKVLKERHDAEYYVNFLTNMIGFLWILVISDLLGVKSWDLFVGESVCIL